MSIGATTPNEHFALGVISRKLGGDGVAYAGALLERALTVIDAHPTRIIELTRDTRARPATVQQMQFVARLAISQFSLSNSRWLFNHVGIARAQNLIPSAIRSPYAVLLCGIEAWDPDLTASRKRALRRAAGRIAISSYTAARVRETHSDVGTILVCPLALLPPNATSGEPDRAMLQLVRECSVLVVGRMSQSERYKGHDELLECWTSVRARVPGAQLVIAGTGDDADRLRAKSASLGLSDHVLFTGFVEEPTLAALRSATAVFALPSRGEGFGLVYLEAMRAGLPCVAGTKDAARDVVLDGETGILVDTDGREQLAAAIVRLLTEKDTRLRFGAAGKARFESEFTFDRYCERLRPVLTQVFG